MLHSDCEPSGNPGVFADVFLVHFSKESALMEEQGTAVVSFMTFAMRTGVARGVYSRMRLGLGSSPQLWRQQQRDRFLCKAGVDFMTSVFFSPQF